MKAGLWSFIFFLFPLTVSLPARTAAELRAGRTLVRIDLERGGIPSGLWYDLDGDGAFSDDELMIDSGPNQGIILTVAELPPGQRSPENARTVLSHPSVAGRLPGPADSWYPGEPYSLTALADSISQKSENAAIIYGRLLWGGSWPYSLRWELTSDGSLAGTFKLLPGRGEPRPSSIIALGLDFRFHFRNRDAFRRRAVHSAVDQRFLSVAAEELRWWSGIPYYNARPEIYGYHGEREIPWPDFNIITLVQNGKNDCRLWKAIDWDTGNLTDWRGAVSHGWLHVEDRRWGLGFGIAGMAERSPASLTADLDSGDLTAALRIRFHPEQARRFDPRGSDNQLLLRDHRFFLVPSAGRWDESRAEKLDRFGMPSGEIVSAEPDPEDYRFSQPTNLPATVAGEGATFLIDEPAGFDRSAWPVTVGVPLRRGEFESLDSLTVTDGDGEPVPCQMEALAYWPDRSIKWVLLDTRVDLPKNKGSVFSLQKGNPGIEPARRVSVRETIGGIRVDTGPLVFEVDRDGSGFIDRAWLDIDSDGEFAPGEMIVDSGGDRRSTLDFVRGDDYRTGDHDIRGTLDESAVRISRIAVEKNGPLKAVVLIKGHYLNRIPSPFTLRLTAFAGLPWIHAQHTFTFTMNPRMEFLRAAGLKLPLLMNQKPRMTIGGEGAPIARNRSITQAGLTQQSPDRAEIWTTAEVDGIVRVIGELHRPCGWGDISDDRWGVTVAVRNFWQEFPKGIAIDCVSRTVAAWFQPPQAPPLDLRRYSRWMYPQYGETTAPWPGQAEWRNVGYATGLAKTSSALFAFHAGHPDAAETDETVRGFQHLSLAVCRPEYYGDVGIAGPFAAYDDERFPEVERTLTDICDWFIYNRERFNWYGLIDYGDIGHMCRPAIRFDDNQPHVFRDGWAYDIGRWGWTNSEGQDALGYFMSFFHSGYRPYFDAGAIAAAHNRDVDIAHWGPVKYQGHTRHNVSHWGDGDFEIRISQPSPFRFQYYLTGDPRSRDIIEAVVDSLYLNYTVTNSADLGAILYGFLARWEMTGDPVWRDRFLNICHSFGDYMGPAGGLPSHGAVIQAPDGRKLSEPERETGYSIGFLHAFGGMHAMTEMHWLTGDEQLGEMLSRHADYCADREDLRETWLIHSHALNATADNRFGARILSNIKANEWDVGVYPRDRKLWRGIAPPTDRFYSDEETSRFGASSLKMRSRFQGARDIYTDYTARCLSPIPVLIWALKDRGLDEGDLPER